MIFEQVTDDKDDEDDDPDDLSLSLYITLKPGAE